VTVLTPTVPIPAASILAELLTVDGAGSGLDADLLDGQSSAHYATAASVAAEASARAAADTALDGRLDVIEADTSLADHEAETTTAHGIPAQIAAAIAALVDTAPGTLDTLNELAAALGDDPNFAATMTAALAGKQPLDSDLTAIADLSTTPFGRALLELVDAAAGRSALELGTMATQAATAYAALTGATFTGLVALPATAPGVNGAARYTAIDPATGRIAINGQEIGDTGWRDVTSICVPGSLDPANVGTFQMLRQGNFVTYRFVNLLMAPGSGSLTLVNGDIESGFRLPLTSPGTFLQFLATRANSALERQNLTGFSERIDWYSRTTLTSGATSTNRPTNGISGQVTFVTPDPWPSVNPGTQVTAPATLS
jgi:hypothetical protein